MKNSDSIVIVSAARTPMGGFQGELKDVTAPQLGAAAIKGALEKAQVAAEDVQEVIMGCVLPAGQGQAPARQASFGAGIPKSVGCTTINKMCGSGMKAAMLAHDLIAAGTNDIMVAGGMESMTNAPYLLLKARGGLRMGHGEVADHMFLDGLEDAYDKGRLMGTFAEDTAERYAFSREAQDAFAIESLTRAKKAIDSGSFDNEVVPVTVHTRTGDRTVSQDRGQLQLNLRRCGGARADAACRGGKTRLASAGKGSRTCHARAGAGVVHHRARRCYQETAREDQLDRRRCRPL